MAEVLGVASSLIAVAQISGNIISLCYDYYRSAKGAQKQIVQILQETQSLRNVVEQLIQLLNKEDKQEAHLSSLKTLSVDNGQFSELQTDIKKLEDWLRSPVTKWRRLGDQLLWPLREREVKQALDSLHRMRSILEFGLMVDVTTSIMEIQKNTRTLISRVLDFQKPMQLTEEQQLQVMLEWLDAPDPSIRHNEIYKKRAEGTGLWLLDCDEFKAWRNARDSSFWLHGIPGCGKSVLTSAVIEHINRFNGEEQDAALAYYHFDFSSEATSTPEGMLRSLVSQLSAEKGKPSQSLDICARTHFGNTRYRTNKIAVYRNSIAQPSVKDLVDVLQGIITEYGNIYIVLDALDECSNQAEIQQVLNEILAFDTNELHIFLTSRRTAEISATLESTVSHIVEATGDKVGGDIEYFVQNELQTHPKLHKWSISLRNEIQNSVISGADGMFRLVESQFAILAKCLTVRDIRKALKGLPRSLSETYALTLDSIDELHRDYAIKILMWLAITPKPLEIREAADILAVDLEAEEGPEFDEDLRMPDPTEISTICTSLVTTATTYLTKRNGKIQKTVTVRLAHYTVREYLLSDTFFSCLRHTNLFANKPQVHHFVTKVSLVYLLSMQNALTDDILEDRPLSRSAAEYWLHHYRETSMDKSLDDLILQLFQDKRQTEPYKNWCRLFDPTKPWKKPDIQLTSFPAPLYFACFSGFETLVEALLPKTSNINTFNNIYQTCLQAAAQNAHIGVVRALIKAGVVPNIEGGAILAASDSGQAEVVELLIEHGADPNQNDFGFSNALTLASRRNNVEVVRVLMKYGADPNNWHSKLRDVNPLESASSRGYKDCVALMLPKASEKTALGGLLAAYKLGADREMLKLFIDFVPDSVLYYAAGLGYDDLVTELLQRGAKPESSLHHRRFEGDDSEDSALVQACTKGHLGMVKQLIDKGANVNAQSTEIWDSYPLACAARKGAADVVKLLLVNGALVNAEGKCGQAIQLAAYEGHLEIVRILLAHDAELDNGNGRYGGPVQAAVLGNHIDIVKMLLAAGADINLKSGDSCISGGGVLVSGTPIQAAARCDNVSMVDFLLNHGADPNICGNKWEEKRACLSIAASTGNLELVNKLIDAGADINYDSRAKSAESGPPLFWAMKEGHSGVVNRLLAAGADPNILCYTHLKDHITVLAQACTGQDTQVIEALLGSGADLHKHSEYRNQSEPLLHTAARSGGVDVIRTLLKHGVDVNEQSHEGWTALHKAARANRSDNVKVMLQEFQADFSLSLENGSLPIHSAASWDSLECLELLVQAGSDINTRNKTGRTPLHWAAEHGSAKAIEWLLQNGADDGIKEDKTNMTARDYAELKLLEASSWEKDQKEKVVEIFDRHTSK